MLAGLPTPAWIAFWSITGLLIGSFLNVAIHRLPLEGETVAHPRRSRCPSCRTVLTWQENIPVLSWLVQRARCRTCGWRIPWRYPLVELITASLFFLVARQTLPHSPALCLVITVAMCGLVVATFVDFDCFEIPDEVSIGGMVLAPIASLAVPELHRSSALAHTFAGAGGEITRLGALSACVAGMLVGGGILWCVGWLGSRAYGRDAMGFGDVKLLAAGGGLCGPGGVLVALMLASVVASFFGLGNMLRFVVLLRARARARGTRFRWGRGLRVARIAGRYVPFGPYLALGIGIVLLYWNDVVGLLR
jgi:leader peptidase (prepilin peptidase)/N-methyltransferase